MSKQKIFTVVFGTALPILLITLLVLVFLFGGCAAKPRNSSRPYLRPSIDTADNLAPMITEKASINNSKINFYGGRYVN